jgi:hypothetical protein
VESYGVAYYGHCYAGAVNSSYVLELSHASVMLSRYYHVTQPLTHLSHCCYTNAMHAFSCSTLTTQGHTSGCNVQLMLNTAIATLLQH